MRIFVMFDLPTGTPSERKAYARFRSYLLSEGFGMEQYSVYSRVCVGAAATDAIRERIRLHTPPFGSVQVIQITEKQYEDRDILLDSRPSNRCDIGVQMTLDF